jgi:hypothetical protein
MENQYSGIKVIENSFAKTTSFQLVCSCSSLDHNLCFSYTKYLDSIYPGEIEIYIQPNQHTGFFKRIWVAFNFIFKRDPFYSSTDVIVKHEEIPRIKEFIEKYEQDCKVAMEK